MSIGNHERQQAVQPIGVTADDVSATGDAAWIFDVVAPITVLRVGAIVTTVIVSTGVVVVDFDRRILTGSDTGRVNKLDGTNATISIPATEAAGKLVYKDVRVDLDPGDQVVPEVITAATTSGAARYFIEYIQRDNAAGEFADMVASA